MRPASAALNAALDLATGCRVAPTRGGLSLPLGDAHHEAVERVRHLDLAGEARIRPHVVAEVQHVLFHRRRPADLLAPFLLDVDVTGGAGAGAAAFGL